MSVSDGPFISHPEHPTIRLRYVERLGGHGVEASEGDWTVYEWLDPGILRDEGMRREMQRAVAAAIANLRLAPLDTALAPLADAEDPNAYLWP